MDKGSTLLFDGVLWLQGVPSAKHPDPQFYLDLKPGTTLAFGERANVLNANSISPDVKLNVYMNGGILDDSKLNPVARLLINRIYPKPSSHFKENIQLMNNPTYGIFQLDYLSSRNERVKVDILDLQGRLLNSKTYDMKEGHNRLDYNISDMAAGIYMVNIHAHDGSATEKVLRY